MDNATVLCVEHLCTSFFTQNGEIKAVNDVSISVPRGRIVGIVGESGCGKSMTARSIMRLLHYPGRIVSGSIKLAGTELLELSEHEMSAVRGEEIGMGATIMNNIESMPHGILFWRAMTQWIGGLGIVFFTIAVLPIFGMGGIQVFAAECWTSSA